MVRHNEANWEGMVKKNCNMIKTYQNYFPLAATSSGGRRGPLCQWGMLGALKGCERFGMSMGQ